MTDKWFILFRLREEYSDGTPYYTPTVINAESDIMSSKHAREIIDKYLKENNILKHYQIRNLKLVIE